MSDLDRMQRLLLSCAGLATGFVIGWYWNYGAHVPSSSSSLDENDDSDDDDDDSNCETDSEDECSFTQEEHKLVLCVRTDLKMQKGKIAAQAGHATLGAYKSGRRRQAQALKVWEAQGQPKIALQISSREQASQLETNAKRLNLNTFVVYDAGRTQVAAVRLSGNSVFLLLRSIWYDSCTYGDELISCFACSMFYSC